MLVSSLTVWARQQVLDTDNWVRASSELLEEDRVRGALAVYLVDELYAAVDVDREVRRVLPEDLRPLSAPIAETFRDVAVRATDGILARPRVQALWREANRRAHRLFLAVVDEGDAGAVAVRGDEVALDLRPLVVQLEDRLGVEGRLPPDAGRIVVVRSDQVTTVRRAVNVLTFTSALAGFAALVLLAGAVWLAPDRRRMLLWTGFALVACGAVLLVVRRLAGDAVVDYLTAAGSTRPIGRDVWLISTSLLRDVALGLAVYGVLVALAAALAGPSRVATAIRRRLAGPFRSAARTHAALALLLLGALVVTPGGGRTLVATLVVLALVVAGVEVLRRRTVAEFPPA